MAKRGMKATDADGLVEAQAGVADPTPAQGESAAMASAPQLPPQSPAPTPAPQPLPIPVTHDQSPDAPVAVRGSADAAFPAAPRPLTAAAGSGAGAVRRG